MSQHRILRTEFFACFWQISHISKLSTDVSVVAAASCFNVYGLKLGMANAVPFCILDASWAYCWKTFYCLLCLLCMYRDFRAFCFCCCSCPCCGCCFLVFLNCKINMPDVFVHRRGVMGWRHDSRLRLKLGDIMCTKVEWYEPDQSNRAKNTVVTWMRMANRIPSACHNRSL